jgi:hypothetical protein
MADRGGGSCGEGSRGGCDGAGYDHHVQFHERARADLGHPGGACEADCGEQWRRGLATVHVAVATSGGNHGEEEFELLFYIFLAGVVALPCAIGFGARGYSFSWWQDTAHPGTGRRGGTWRYGARAPQTWGQRLVAASPSRLLRIGSVIDAE